VEDSTRSEILGQSQAHHGQRFLQSSRSEASGARMLMFKTTAGTLEQTPGALGSRVA